MGEGKVPGQSVCGSKRNRGRTERRKDMEDTMSEPKSKPSSVRGQLVFIHTEVNGSIIRGRFPLEKIPKLLKFQKSFDQPPFEPLPEDYQI